MVNSSQENKNNESFEKLYLKERKKNHLFVVVAAVLSIFLVGLVIFNLQTQKLSTEQVPNQAQDFPGSFGQNPGGFQGQRGLQEIDRFFNEDGTVDTDQVDQLKENLPSGIEGRFLPRVSSQIDSAVDGNDITFEQGEELKEAFGVPSDTNTN